jgi:hypothetical protein
MFPLTQFLYHTNPTEIDNKKNESSSNRNDSHTGNKKKKQWRIKSSGINENTGPITIGINRDWMRFGLTELELEIGLITWPHLAWLGLVLFVLQTETIRRSSIDFRLRVGDGTSPAHQIENTSQQMDDALNSINLKHGEQMERHRKQERIQLRRFGRFFNCKETHISHMHITSHRQRNDTTQNQSRSPSSNGRSNHPLHDPDGSDYPTIIFDSLFFKFKRASHRRLPAAEEVQRNQTRADS